MAKAPDPVAGPGRPAAPPGPPRWVKVGALVVGVLVLIVVLLHLTGVTSGHGPGHHLSTASSSGQAAAAPGAYRS